MGVRWKLNTGKFFARRFAVKPYRPAYDCFCLARAPDTGRRFVTAGRNSKDRVSEHHSQRFSDMVLSLPEAVAIIA